jgi:hypothetical protein
MEDVVRTGLPIVLFVSMVFIMLTTEYVIARNDDRGGTGANFIVAWGAEEPVYEPVVEAVMISAAGTQGLSLLSPARVLEEKQ